MSCGKGHVNVHLTKAVLESALRILQSQWQQQRQFVYAVFCDLGLVETTTQRSTDGGSVRVTLNVVC